MQPPDNDTAPSESGEREHWKSRLGFIAATAGLSIGLGTVWRFPYVAGENGGGAFLLVYLPAVILLGIPLFTVEISLGRASQRTPVAGMRRLTGNKAGIWNLIGWLAVLAAFGILTYYVMLLAWIADYTVLTATGRFVGVTPDEVAAAFTDMSGSPGRVLGWMVALSIGIGLIVTRGLQRGIEAASRVLMPVLAVLMIVLAAGALTLDGAAEGLKWFLMPRTEGLTPGVVLTALGQAFFSLSIGMAAAFVFGSYLHPTDSDIPGAAATVAVFDTLAAICAGLIVFPAVFALGLQPDSGPELVFVTMTNVFAQVPFGQLVGTAFFSLLLLAGVTSGMATVEALTGSAIDSLGTGRGKTVWVTLGAALLFGIPGVLSFGPWSDIEFFGRTIFGNIDFVFGTVFLALGGMLMALYTAFVWGFDRFQTETNVGAGRVRVGASWRIFINVIVPLAVVFVVLSATGVFG